MTMFTARLSDEERDIICKIGNGNRSAGLRKLLFCYNSDDNQRAKNDFEHIKELEKIIKDQRHIIKSLQKIIEKNEQ